MFVHLQVYSNYSLLKGVSHVQELVGTAQHLGYKYLALTDRNNLYGVHEFLACCRQYDVTPLIGSHVVDETDSIVALVRTQVGLQNLSTVLSRKNLNQNANIIDLFQSHHDGLILLSTQQHVLTRLHNNVEYVYAAINESGLALYQWARTCGIPSVVVGEVYSHQKHMHGFRRVLQAIESQSTIYDDAFAEYPSGGVLVACDEISQRFSWCLDAVEQTNSIAQLCDVTDIYYGLVMPAYSEDSASARDVLRIRAQEGVHQRYQQPSRKVWNRLQYELHIITNMGFDSYFLTVAELVRYQRLICGRGSGAASIVAYVLGITNVDPIEHNLYFERFLNHERSDPPDIDIDFAWDERDTIVQAAIDRHGKENCAFVCNHVRFQSRSALREVARAYALPDGEITAMSKLLARKRRSLRAQKVPNSRRAAYDQLRTFDQPWPEILSHATRLTGFPRHLSVHVGGLVITPEPIEHYVPIEMAAKGVPVTTWDKDGVEQAGLVKIDLLGNRSLAVVRDAINNVRSNGFVFDIDTWDPLRDEKTQKLIAEGDTIGVFYVESPAMRQLQKKTKCGDFEHIVIHSSIIRPAANKYINEYVERLHGKAYDPIHPRLGGLLAETYGIMCYQEDVSRVAIAMAGFSPGQADGLRRVLSKKNKAQPLAKYKQQFFQGCIELQVSMDVVEQLWGMILSFDGYSFCKPHSASYAMLSFQAAYVKAHFPAEFMSAVLTNRGGYYTAAAYISEAKRMGIVVLSPSVNHSEIGYKGRGNELRVGLMAVKGLSQKAMQALITVRQSKGKYRSIYDLLHDARLTPHDVQQLIKSGACDEFRENRVTLQWQVLEFSQQSGQQLDLWEHDTLDNTDLDLQLPTSSDLLMQEFETLGFLCRHHPLDFYANQLQQRSTVKACQMHAHIGSMVTMVGWPITRKTVLTMKGEPMEFVSFEDQTGIYETVLFPKVYMQYNAVLEGVRPFILHGYVQSEYGAIVLSIQDVQYL